MSASARRLGKWFAAATASVVLLTGCTAQNWSPDWPASVGALSHSGPIKAQNFIVVANEDGNGALLGSIVTSEDISLTQVAVQAEKADGEYGNTVPIQIVEGQIPAGKTLKFDPSTALVEGAGLEAGLLAIVGLEFSDGTQLLLDAPVMSAEHPYFKTALEG